MALPNRGPIQFESNGNVVSEILEGYAKYGFYVLENFLDKKDLQDWQDDFDTYLAIRTKELEDAGIFSKFVPLLDGELKITLSEINYVP